MTRIDKRLNIVLEVVPASLPGQTPPPSLHVHSMPITRAVYDQHFLILAMTVSQMYAKGIGAGTCGRIAMNMMRRVAKEQDAAASVPGMESMAVQNEVDQLLLPAIWQRTNVLMPSDAGWTTLPFQEVIDGKKMDEDDIAEVQNYLVFFTAASWVHMVSELLATLYPVWQASGALLVSSNCTEFASSLRTSKKDETTGVKATVSSNPV